MSSSKATPASALAPVAAPITVTVKVQLKALALPEADGGYSIIVPALPGCFSEADTLDDVQAQVIEASELWLDSMHDQTKDEAVRVARGEAE